MGDGGTGSRASSQQGRSVDSEAERQLLGACLRGGRGVVEQALELNVREADFDHPGRAAIWAVLAKLAGEDRHIDTLVVVDELQHAGQLDAVGGAAAVAQLELGVDTTGAAGAHALLVVQGAAYRRISEVSQLLHQGAVERDTSAPELLAEAQDAFLRLNERAAGATDIVDRVAAVNRVLDSAGKQAPGAIPTGFAAIDGLMRGGLRPGHLVLIAARPAMGKTAFGLAIAANIADEGIPVGFISLEMTGEELIEREIAARSKVPIANWRIRHEGGAVHAAAKHVDERALHIIDRAGLTIGEVCAAARRMKTRQHIGVLVVDHLGLVRPSERYAGNRTQEVAEVSAALRALASHLDIPVVALSQLNRGVESRTDKRPSLGDLRDSGALEQDANVVMFLHRPEYYLKENTPEHQLRLCEVIVAKNRGGATDVVELIFDGPTMRFTSKAVAS